MKIINSIVLLAIIIITLSCQQKKTYNEKKQIVVTGKVHNYNGKNAKLNFIYSQPGVNKVTELIDIDSIGNFQFIFEGYIPLDAMIFEKNSLANINFIYHPEDSIHIEFEAKNKPLEIIKTVKYSGDRANTNNQINNFQVLREENNLGYDAVNTSKSFKKKVADFVLEMDSVKEKQLKIYNSFVKEYSPTDDAKKWSELFALETYYYFLDAYSWENTEVPNNYFDYNKDILPITFDKLIGWTVLENRLNQYFRANIFPKFEEQYPYIDLIGMLTDKSSKSDSLFIQFVRENYKDKLHRQLIISGIYKSLLDMNSTESYQRNLVALQTELNEDFILKPLHETYKKTQENLNNPKEITAELLKKMEGSSIEKTFKKILKDNEGKVIYLDCWSTTCKPCIDDMPDSKLLMAKFNPQDVAFVYICLDKDESKWKELLSEFKLDGSQQYRIENEESQSLQDVMQFNAVPYHILINKNGDIIEQGNNLRPSMESTEVKIMEQI